MTDRPVGDTVKTRSRITRVVNTMGEVGADRRSERRKGRRIRTRKKAAEAGDNRRIKRKIGREMARDIA